MSVNILYRNSFNFAKRRALLLRFYSIKSDTNELHGVNYCANVVSVIFWYFDCSVTDRQYDYENFLATLLMTKAIRSPAFVIRAFNVEIAKIQDQTSDQNIAEFRLQFWLDTLKDIYKADQNLRNIPANPVAQELFKVCCTYNLPRRHLERLISSRSTLLKTKYFRSMEDVERYAEETVSPVYYLILSAAGIKNVHADHVASHLGKAQGIVNILRSLLVSSHHKMVSLPMETLMRYNISQETVLRCEDSDKMRNVVFEIASRANQHLTKARNIAVPKLVNQIFLPAVFIDAYLQQLQTRHFNVFDEVLKRRSATLPFQLYYKRLLNRY